MNIVAFNSEDSFILNYSCLVWSLCGFIITINTQTRLANFFKSLHKLLLAILLVRLILCFHFFHLLYTKYEKKSKVNIVAFNSEDSFILNYSCLVWSLCGFIITINTQTRLANFFKSLHKLLLAILLVRLILCFHFFHLLYGNSWSLHTSFHDVYFSELSGRFSFFLFNYGAFLFFNFIFFCSSNGRNKLYACFCRHFIGALKP